jgi:hypothetical protein
MTETDKVSEKLDSYPKWKDRSRETIQAEFAKND